MVSKTRTRALLLIYILFVCRLGTPLAAEELNTVVGTAFRVAYAAQLQSQKVQLLNSSLGTFGIILIGPLKTFTILEIESSFCYK